jgi:hypothetical protein
MTSMPEKDRELLDSRLSRNRTDSIFELIARLKREVARGEAVYSPDELKRLTAKLEDYEYMLERLTSG